MTTTAPAGLFAWQAGLTAPRLDITEPGVAWITNVRFAHTAQCGSCRARVTVYTDGGAIRAQITGGPRARWSVVERAGAEPAWPTTCPGGHPFHRLQWADEKPAQRERAYCYGTDLQGHPAYQTLIGHDGLLDRAYRHIRTSDTDCARTADHAAGIHSATY